MTSKIITKIFCFEIKSRPLFFTMRSPYLISTLLTFILLLYLPKLAFSQSKIKEKQVQKRICPFFKKSNSKNIISPLFLARYKQYQLDSLKKRSIILPYFQLYSLNGQKHFVRKRWDLWIDGGPYLSSLLGETVVGYWGDLEQRISATKVTNVTTSPTNNNSSFGQFLKKIIAKKSVMGVQDEFDVRYDHNIRYMNSQHNYITLKNNTILFLIGFRLAIGD